MKIHFLGAAREVTGSCFLVEAAGRHVLVECGLIQGSHSDEARNRDPFPFNPEKIDAVVLTHAHLDHSGRLPLLFNSGYRGPVYTQRASRDLARIMLKDAGFLNEKDVEWDNRKRQRKHLPLLEPLYTVKDAQAALRHFRAVDYDEIIEITKGVKIRFQDAGHILGSAIVEMWLEEGGVQRKLVFSGDLGHKGAPILRDPVKLSEADLVIMESTYGDRAHRSWEATWAEMDEIFSVATQARGNILIPAFAVGRTQELLYAFKRNYQRWNLERWTIFLDSPMAIAATTTYSRHAALYDREATAEHEHKGGLFDLPNLHMSRTAQQSMRINRIESGAIIIAGSGMCEGGRIRHHFKHNIWRAKNRVLIVGYQAQGTLGRALVDGADTIKLWGESIRVAAKVQTIGGFSAHADCNGLAEWYAAFAERPPVALVHGEANAMGAFAARLTGAGVRRVFQPAAGAQIDLVNMNES